MGDFKQKYWYENNMKNIITVILKNMGSSDKKRHPSCKQSDVATTLLSRDWKGLSNFASNGIVEVICEKK